MNVVNQNLHPQLTASRRFNLQPKQSGNCSVAVTNSGATALTLYSDTVNYSSADNLIASQINKISSASLYSNPAKYYTTLSFNADGKYTIIITDILGKTLLTKIGVGIKEKNTIQLDVNKYASGTYLITITDSKGNKQSSKFVKE